MTNEVRHAPFQFDIFSDDVIRGDAWIPRQSEPGAAIIVCHGFKGFKDWGFFPHITRELAVRTGCPAVCFNFTGSGIGSEPEEFTELEKFGRNTFTRELQDLEIVMDRLAASQAGDTPLPPASRFGLLGHSRGGATALLKAATRSQVRGLVTWSSIAATERYGERYREAWEEDGTAWIRNARTGQSMPLHENVRHDIRAHPDRLDLERAAESLRIPYLIVHGREDESVPAADAERLAAAAGERATLRWIDGAGHTMNAGHPFTGPNEKLEEALDASAEALERALVPGGSSS